MCLFVGMWVRGTQSRDRRDDVFMDYINCSGLKLGCFLFVPCSHTALSLIAGPRGRGLRPVSVQGGGGAGAGGRGGGGGVYLESYTLESRFLRRWNQQEEDFITRGNWKGKQDAWVITRHVRASARCALPQDAPPPLLCLSLTVDLMKRHSA